ncbi:MAG TPA: hypothetical protein VM686_06095 [Polyangiaceae bacterium]|nr:hypothetical protein [Polyangiaceae bacterium]
MNRFTVARVLGGVAGLLLVGGWFAYERLRPPPCPGGLFVEFRPPLLAPGPYRFRLELDGGERVCSFEATPGGNARKTDCKMALEITSRLQGDVQSIVGLAVAAAPERVRLEVKQGGELVYDTGLEPEYAPYAVRREDDRRFCGDRAFVKPSCIRGSSQCAPYAAACDGPEDCSAPKICCASAEWGREYGAKAASECSSLQGCLDRFARVACHGDGDCANGGLCTDGSLAAEFKPALKACQERQR